jgi:hypothetical protein
VTIPQLVIVAVAAGRHPSSVVIAACHPGHPDHGPGVVGGGCGQAEEVMCRQREEEEFEFMKQHLGLSTHEILELEEMLGQRVK